MRQRVKLRRNQGETDSVKIGRGVKQGCCMSSILINLYGEYLMLAEVEDFKIGESIINKVRFADNTAIIVKTQEELQDMVNRLVATGRKYGMKINIDKSQVMRVSRSNESLHIKVNNRELKEVDNFKYLGSVLTRDGYCTREFKVRIAIAKEAFNRQMSLLTSKLNIELKKN
jgi:Reverse transcriptase (RNA-dependent DNA polymerase).